MTVAPSIQCDLFLLSWTLTSGGILVSDFSAIANKNLGSEMNGILRNPYGFIPNVLYVDYYERAGPGNRYGHQYDPTLAG
jgi:hypothetical protein